MEAYELGKRIGRGNYGSVYVAKDTRNSRWYCLKMIMMEAHSEEERGAGSALPAMPALFACACDVLTAACACARSFRPRRKGAAGGRGAPWP